MQSEELFNSTLENSNEQQNQEAPENQPQDGQQFVPITLEGLSQQMDEEERNNFLPRLDSSIIYLLEEFSLLEQATGIEWETLSEIDMSEVDAKKFADSKEKLEYILELVKQKFYSKWYQEMQTWQSWSLSYKVDQVHEWEKSLEQKVTEYNNLQSKDEQSQTLLQQIRAAIVLWKRLQKMAEVEYEAETNQKPLPTEKPSSPSQPDNNRRATIIDLNPRRNDFVDKAYQLSEEPVDLPVPTPVGTTASPLYTSASEEITTTSSTANNNNANSAVNFANVKKKMLFDTSKPVAQIEVTIYDAVKTGTGAKSFWYYPIEVKTKDEEFTELNLKAVKRRYSDFEWLHEALSIKYPACIIPVLPKKNPAAALGGIFSSQEDLKQILSFRKRALYYFLNRVVEHPILQRAESLMQFLTITDEKQFTELKKNKIVSNSFVLNSKVPLVFRKQVTKEPEWIKQRLVRINETEAAIKLLKNQMLAIITSTKELSSAFMGFGSLCGQFANIEKEAKLRSALHDFSFSTEQLSTSILSQADKQSIALFEPLLYYEGMCTATKQAVNHLNYYRMDYDYFDATAKSLDQQAEKYAQGKKMEPQILEEKRRAVAEMQEKAEAAKEDILVLEELLKKNIERFEEEKGADFSVMIQYFKQLQVDFASSVKSNMVNLLPSISDASHGDDEYANNFLKKK